MSWYEKLSFLVTTIGFWNCLVFCVAYPLSSRGKWRETEIGQWLMISMGTLGSIFLLILSNRLFGDWPGRQWLAFLFYIIYVAVTAWPLRLLYVSMTKRHVESEQPKEGAVS